MSQQRNIAIARKLLQGIGNGLDPSEIAAPFAADLTFEIQGDDGVLPWIGHKTGRQAVAEFIRDVRALTEPVTFDVEDILVSDQPRRNHWCPVDPDQGDRQDHRKHNLQSF